MNKRASLTVVFLIFELFLSAIFIGCARTSETVTTGTVTSETVTTGTVTSGTVTSGTVTSGTVTSETVTVTFIINTTDSVLNAPVLSQEIKKGEAISRPNPDPSRTGYGFEGWFTNQVGSGSPYDFSAAINSDISLYAKWMISEFDVIFDFNYDGAPANQVNKVTYNSTVSSPESPTRESYTLIVWCTDEECLTPFIFDTQITGTLTLYAKWQELQANEFEITFHYNIPGGSQYIISSIIESGQLVSEPEAPVGAPDGDFITAINFQGWYDGEVEYDFSTPVIENKDLYSKFETKYIFEAEYVDLTDKEGTVYSSGANDEDLIVIDSVNKRDQDASNGYSIGHIYVPWIFIEFVIYSDVDVDNVTLEARLSAQYRDIYIAPKSAIIGGKEYWSFTFAVNESTEDVEQAIRNNSELLDGMLNYSPIALEGATPELVYPMRKFTNHIICENISLKAGENRILLMVSNNADYASTIIACAPMIDCLYITATGAVLSWTPKIENLAHAVDRE